MDSDISFTKLFDRLQAEYEEAWLADVFVAPASFESLLGMRSLAIFGEEGHGKSALQLRTMQLAQEAGRLIVEWTPQLRPELTGSPATLEYIRQLIAEWAKALFLYIGTYPNRFSALPEWASELLIWIIRERIPGRWDYHLSRLKWGGHEEGHRLLQQWGKKELDPGLSPDISDSQLIDELLLVSQMLAISGTWLIVDGTKSWLDLQKDDLLAMFRDITMALDNFEKPGLAWRFILPKSFDLPLSRSSAIQRRRVSRYHINWQPSELRRIVERRVEVALGLTEFSLHSIVDSDANEMLRYLEKYGGRSPRSWLALTRPFVVAFVRGGGQDAISIQQWEGLRRKFAPPLRIDPVAREVYVGESIIEGLSPSLYRTLLYLYELPDHQCTRSELYWHAYRQSEQSFDSPHVDIEKWEDPRDWGAALDTVVWRLRKAIEWDSGNPLYIHTSRGEQRGLGDVWLENTQ